MYFGINGLKAKSHCRWQDEPRERRRSILWEMDCSDGPCFEHETQPEKRLLVALISQALQDLMTCPKDSYSFIYAVRWIRGMKSGIPIEDCCEHLGVDVECVRNAADKIINFPARDEIERNIDRRVQAFNSAYSPVMINMLVRGDSAEIAKYMIKKTRHQAKDKQLCDDLLVATSSPES